MNQHTDMLSDEEGMAIVPLSILLLSVIGHDVISWDYTALRVEMEERWGPIGTQTWQKVMALTVMLSTDIAWREWEVFENLVASIVGEMPIFSYVQPPEPAEISIALHVMQSVASHDLSDEVKKYIVSACLNDGMWYLNGTHLEVAASSLRDYDRDLGIDRDDNSVMLALANANGFYANPDTAAEVQANHVLDVYLTTETYRKKEREQINRLSRSH